MAKIYISSTYEDLSDARARVYHTLRQMKHDPQAMEDYLATDQRPLDRCLEDVETCDLYVGILAWRYGYIPKRDNPDGKSITELEYRHAVKSKRRCLFFVLHEDAPWPRIKMEMDQTTQEKLEALRKEVLENHSPTLFRNITELPGLVVMAIREWETQQQIRAVAKEQKEQKLIIVEHQDLINQLVYFSMSASTFRHLCGIALLHRYNYDNLNEHFRREMYFLRDHGFIRPNFLVFDENFHNSNLAEKAEPTEIGWLIVKLRKAEIPTDWLEPTNKPNLRIDPSKL